MSRATLQLRHGSGIAGADPGHEAVSGSDPVPRRRRPELEAVGPLVDGRCAEQSEVGRVVPREPGARGARRALDLFGVRTCRAESISLARVCSGTCTRAQSTSFLDRHHEKPTVSSAFSQESSTDDLGTLRCLGSRPHTSAQTWGADAHSGAFDVRTGRTVEALAGECLAPCVPSGRGRKEREGWSGIDLKGSLPGSLTGRHPAMARRRQRRRPSPEFARRQVRGGGRRTPERASR